MIILCTPIYMGFSGTDSLVFALSLKLALEITAKNCASQQSSTRDSVGFPDLQHNNYSIKALSDVAVGYWVHRLRKLNKRGNKYSLVNINNSSLTRLVDRAFEVTESVCIGNVSCLNCAIFLQRILEAIFEDGRDGPLWAYKQMWPPPSSHSPLIPEADRWGKGSYFHFLHSSSKIFF